MNGWREIRPVLLVCSVAPILVTLFYDVSEYPPHRRLTVKIMVIPSCLPRRLGRPTYKYSMAIFFQSTVHLFS